MSDVKFPDGIIVKRRDNAPDFVLCDVSIKTDEFIAWLKNNTENGWCNLQALVGQSGEPYMKLNDFKPDASKAGSRAPSKPQAALPRAGSTAGSYQDDGDDEVPF